MDPPKQYVLVRTFWVARYSCVVGLLGVFFGFLLFLFCFLKFSNFSFLLALSLLVAPTRPMPAPSTEVLQRRRPALRAAVGPQLRSAVLPGAAACAHGFGSQQPLWAPRCEVRSSVCYSLGYPQRKVSSVAVKEAATFLPDKQQHC